MQRCARTSPAAVGLSATQADNMVERPDERRRAPRAEADFEIQLFGPTGAHSARIRDISENGLACESSAAVDEMTVLELGLALPGAPTQKIQGAVVRCEPIAGSDPASFDLAVFFTDVPMQARTALKSFVEGKLAST